MTEREELITYILAQTRNRGYDYVYENDSFCFWKGDGSTHTSFYVVQGMAGDWEKKCIVDSLITKAEACQRGEKKPVVKGYKVHCPKCMCVEFEVYVKDEKTHAHCLKCGDISVVRVYKHTELKGG